MIVVSLIIAHSLLALIFDLKEFGNHLQHSLVFLCITFAAFTIAEYCKTHQEKWKIMNVLVLFFQFLILVNLIFRPDDVAALTNRNYLVFSLLSISILSGVMEGRINVRRLLYHFFFALVLSLFLQSIAGFICSLICISYLFKGLGGKGRIKNLGLKIFIIMSAASAAILVFNDDYITHKVVTFYNNFDNPDFLSRESGAQRALMMHYGREIISENPEVGVGLYNSRYFWSSTRFPDEVSTHLHNTYLELLVSFGLFFGVLWFLYLFRISFLKRLFGREPFDLVCLGFLISLVFAFANTVFLQMQAWFWLVATHYLIQRDFL